MTSYKSCIIYLLSYIVTCVAMFACALMVTSSYSATSDNMNINANINVEQIYYQTIDKKYGQTWKVSVCKGTSAGGIATAPNKISFHKITTNEAHLVSEENVGGQFLSATILRDNTKFIYTTWIGTHYWVRVYLLDDDAVKNVLEIGSYSPPSFITLKSGKQGLLIDMNNNQISKRPYTYDIYVFDENSYEVFRSVSLNALLTIDEQSKGSGLEKGKTGVVNTKP